MQNLKTSNTSAFLALVFLIICLYQGNIAKQTLEGKATAQTAVNESIQKWKQSYKALSGTAIKWQEHYKSSKSVNDFVSLFALVGLEQYKLKSDIDTMTLSKAEPVQQNGTSIGLSKMCIQTSSAGRDGFEVRAQDYDTLFAGLKALAARPDIYIGSIDIRADKNLPIASLGDFCLLLRDD